MKYGPQQAPGDLPTGVLSMRALAGGKAAGSKATKRTRKRRKHEPGQGSQNEGDTQEEGNRAREKLEGISDRMDMAQEEMDWEEAVHSVMAEEGAERLVKGLWYRDDMGPGTRGAETGCRLVAQNMQGKCGHHDGKMYKMEEELIWNLKI